MTYLSWFYQNLAYNPAAIKQAAINEYVSKYSAPGGMRAGFEYYRARLNGIVRDRETVTRGLDNAKATQEWIDVVRIHYSFIRPHSAIEGQTLAEAAAINLNLGENNIHYLQEDNPHGIGLEIAKWYETISR